MEDRSNFVLLSVVAIVAIVSLVVLVTAPRQAGQAPVTTEFVTETSFPSEFESEDIAGMAYAQCNNEKYIAKNREVTKSSVIRGKGSNKDSYQLALEAAVRDVTNVISDDRIAIFDELDAKARDYCAARGCDSTNVNRDDSSDVKTIQSGFAVGSIRVSTTETVPEKTNLNSYANSNNVLLPVKVHRRDADGTYYVELEIQTVSQSNKKLEVPCQDLAQV
ncbi:hypothetical protein J4457_01125 [Candidatus Woesearchaeota archaeon]|nr:hypothetical protein [Candidatus Woesearchaeota archaeon]